VKRTAELKPFENYVFQSSASRTLVQIARPPSAEALGYFHSVRFADVENNFCSKVDSKLRPAAAQPQMNI
jgi:hypothetical protein